MKAFVATLFASLALVTAAAAEPVAFVGKGDGVWYMNQIYTRPMHKNVGPVTLAQINAQRNGSGGDLCYVTGMDRGSVVAIDRATQKDIERTFALDSSDPFQRTYEPVPGKLFTIRSGTYEICDNGGIGSFVLIHDAQGKIIDYEEWAWSSDEQHLMFIRGQADAPYRSTCFQCDDVTRLYYDAGRNRFYWKYEGG